MKNGCEKFLKKFYCFFLVPLYGQCGGLTYTGITSCVYGTTCFVQSDYFSQCLFTCPSGWSCVAATTTAMVPRDNTTLSTLFYFSYFC